METDRRNGLSGHKPGSIAIRRVAFPASEGARRYRISAERQLKSRQWVHMEMMTAKGSKVNLDPSRALALDANDRPAADHGGRAGLPDSADDDDWRCDADRDGLGCGNADCNNAVRDRNAGREKTSHGNHCADKPAATEPLRPKPPSALTGRARQRLWLRGTLELAHVGA